MFKLKGTICKELKESLRIKSLQIESMNNNIKIRKITKKILELQSTIFEVKNLLHKINNRSELAEERISDLKTGQLRLSCLKI